MFARKFLYLLLPILWFTFAVKAQEAYKFKETTYLRWDIGEVYVVHEFAEELKKTPDVNGFILVFGRRGQSLRYADYVRTHLQLYKINPERIQTGYGGESESRKMELWILPKTIAPPKFIADADYKEVTYFDDYSWSCEICGYMRRDALELFAQELKKHPKTKAYIIVHPSKWEYSTIRTRRQAQRKAVIERRFLNKLGIKNSRIVALLGDYAGYERADLWIAPNDSKPPK